MPKSGYCLQNDQEKEVAVCHLAKLNEEVLGEECETCVFGCSDKVVRELSIILISIKDSIDFKYTPRFGLIIVITSGLT